MNENPTPGIAPTPTPNPEPTPTPTPTPTPAPGATPAPGQVPSPIAPIDTPNVTPMPATAPKSKTGLIIGIIVGALVICGGVLAAVFLLGPAKKDPNTVVYNAFSNLVANKKGSHENTNFDGSISIGAMDMSLYDFTINGRANKTAIELNLSFSSNMLLGDTNIEASAIANEKNLFVKVDGISDLADSYDLEIDLSNVEGEWYGISYEELAKYADASGIKLNAKILDEDEDDFDVDATNNEATQCIQKELESLKDSKKGDKLLELYDAHAFIDAKEYDGDEVKAKKDTLYAITIDEAKFVDWTNAVLIESNLFDDIFDCLGTSIRDMNPIELSDLEGFEFPTLYIEINGNEEITRFYFPIETEDGMNLTIDFVVDYPATLEILEPENAKTIEDLMEDLQLSPVKTTNKKFLIQ